MTGLELLAVEVMLATGPDWGMHSRCNASSEHAECEQIAQVWLEMREHVLFESSFDLQRHFCYQVLELGSDPPFTPDLRFPPEHQEDYHDHQRRMAGWLREAFGRAETISTNL